MSAVNNNSLGLYISIPFCRSKCTYCNFASGVYPASEHGRYVDRLISDLAGAATWAAKMEVELPRQVDTIYLGGGTPSLLEPELMTRLFAAVRERFAVDDDAEITVECAPGQIADATLAAMAEAGVNRVSLGVQSFIDKEAAQSGRLHTRASTLEDLLRLRAAGIKNLNLDLIAGLAGQTMASWRESVAVLLETGVEHASVYMLEVDEESRLGSELLNGGARYGAELVPADDVIAQMYEEAVEAFTRAGLAQYEISNFARDGHESRHNQRYWLRRPYLGVGLDASSMLRAADGSVLRAVTASDLKDYLAGVSGHETSWQGEYQQMEEAWFLGLRRNEGVSLVDLRGEFGEAAVAQAENVVARLVQDGLLERTNDRVSLTLKGRMISNDVFAEFLGLCATARS